MSLATYSSFIYGFRTDAISQYMNIDEGGGELAAVLPIGASTMTEFMNLVKTALDGVGGNTYTVLVDRETRIVTISADGPFDILLGTGTQLGSAPWELLGFTQGVDLTGLSSYSGASAAGFEYRPQLWLQSYVDFPLNQAKISPTVNESANGIIEVVQFGTSKIAEMEIKYITNRDIGSSYIRNNPNGLEDTVAFFEDIVQRDPFEFIKDITDYNTFESVILESTANSRDGTKFIIREMVNRGLNGYYETKKFKLRLLG